MTKEELEQELKQAQQEIEHVQGPKCEVYSRVVGYLRPVQGWNKGKKEEYALRKTYHVCACKGEL